MTLSNYQGIPCACHMIATVLRHLLQLDRLSCAPLTMDDDESNMIHVTAIRETVNAVKELVTDVRRSETSNMLSSTLKQSNDTRWNSLLTMLNSYEKVKDEVRCMLEERNQLHRIHSIDHLLIKTLTTFLEPFKQAMEYLEEETYPTIHKVFFMERKLLQCMAS